MQIVSIVVNVAVAIMDVVLILTILKGWKR